jgi:anti-anti-sigma regulatory factor
MSTLDAVPAPWGHPADDLGAELEVQVRPGGLAVAGEIDIANRAAFRAALHQVFTLGRGAVLLDLGHVTHADVATAFMLISAARRHRRPLIVVDAPRLLARLLLRYWPADRSTESTVSGRVTVQITSGGASLIPAGLLRAAERSGPQRRGQAHRVVLDGVGQQAVVRWARGRSSDVDVGGSSGVSVPHTKAVTVKRLRVSIVTASKSPPDARARHERGRVRRGGRRRVPTQGPGVGAPRPPARIRP